MRRARRRLRKDLSPLKAQRCIPSGTHSPEENRSDAAARYALTVCRELGYSLFALRYQEELPHGGKVERYPATLILAAPFTDPRIRKTAKGRVLDFVTDRRKQLMHRVLKRGLTAYDWLEDLYISKSNGEERVRAELLRIHLELRAQNP